MALRQVAAELHCDHVPQYFAALLPAVCIGANFDFSKGLLTNWAETTIA